MVTPPAVVAALIKALLSATVLDALARALATVLPVGKDIATRDDLAAAVQDIPTRGDVAAVSRELQKRITAMEAEIAAMRAGITMLKAATFTFGTVMLVLLIKLVFFP